MSVQAGIFYFDQRPIEQALISCARLRLSAHCRGVGSEHIIPGLWMGFRESRFHSAPHHTQQPHCSRQRNWITFDGRLDNRDDLGLLLGESPSQSTDAGLAAAAYEKWGHSALARLIGDWSLVIWDESQRRIVLASDYMGVRALFYFSAPNFVAWSSSLKHLVTWMNASDDLDNYYIASYLNIAPTYDRTIYRQISYVPCAHSIVLDSKGGLSKTSFWKAPVENRTHLTLDSDYEEALIHLFREAIIGRLRDDDVVGCDLSGGLDSSSVTCMAHHLIHTRSVSARRLVTLSNIDPSMDDLEFIPIIETHCGVKGKHFDIGTIWSLEVGSGALPGAGSPVLQERSDWLCENNVRVVLTGRGGDLLMGNLPDDIDQLADSLQGWRWSTFLTEAYAWSRALRVPIWHVLWRSAIPLLRSSVRELSWSRNSTITGDAYGHMQKRSLLNTRFMRQYFERSQPADSISYEQARPSHRHFLFNLLSYQTSHSLSNVMQPESVAITHPYCHRPLVEFIVSIPRNQLCKPGRPRDLMRRAFAGLLPQIVRDRKTKAVAHTRIDLGIQSLAATLLEDSQGFLVASRGYTDESILRECLRNPNPTIFRRAELVQLMNLEVWFRTRLGFSEPTMSSTETAVHIA